MRSVASIIEDFDEFDGEDSIEIKSLLSRLPEEYETDYFVFSASENISEEETIRGLPIKQVVKRAMFRKFDSYIKETYYKSKAD